MSDIKGWPTKGTVLVTAGELDDITKERDALRAELDRLHSWDGLMELLDEHWPADIFTGESGDPGPRMIVAMREIDRLRARLAAAELNQWQPIATAPKMRKIIVHYLNGLGKHRTVMACYYVENSLEMHDDYDYVGTTDEYTGFADAGWYEEHDSEAPLMPLDVEPDFWMPLPDPPINAHLAAAREGDVRCLVRKVGTDEPLPRCAEYPKCICGGPSLALAREWIESSGHKVWCGPYVCECGRDALLAALGG